jgi:hypothetical protein
MAILASALEWKFNILYLKPAAHISSKLMQNICYWIIYSVKK